MKKRVKILDSIAGLGDPRPKAELDAKYERLRQQMKMQDKPPAASAIEASITEFKTRDRYGDPAIGFSKDWAFKAGDEILIEAELAEKWAAGGICVEIVAEKKAA